MNNKPLTSDERLVDRAFGQRLDRRNLRQWRSCLDQPARKGRHRLSGPSYFDRDTARIVLAPADQPQPVGPPPEEWPKANSLHHTTDPELTPDVLSAGRSHRHILSSKPPPAAAISWRALLNQ